MHGLYIFITVQLYILCSYSIMYKVHTSAKKSYVLSAYILHEVRFYEVPLHMEVH